MKVKKEKPLSLGQRKQLRRRIQDIPFYGWESVGEDDLPFDPAKTFILDQIELFRKTRSLEIFGGDLSFRESGFVHTKKPTNRIAFRSPGNEGTTKGDVVEVGQGLPSLFKPGTTTSVDGELLKIWREDRRKFRIKTKRETAAQINRRMRMKFLPKIDAMTPYEVVGIERFHMDFEKVKLGMRKRKPYEFKPLPSIEEQRLENERTQKIIDKMLNPQIEIYKRQNEELERNHHKFYTTLPEILKEDAKKKERRMREIELEKKGKRRCSTSRVIKRRTPEENSKILSKIIKKERQSFKYLAPIMPVAVDEQRKLFESQFQSEYLEKQHNFTEDIQEKFKTAFTSLPVTVIEPFPTHLLIRALPKVSPKSTVFKNALKFWKQMHQLDPTIKFESVFMDFLFDPELDPPVQRADALMITSSLVDLQEDFRDRVRYDFLRMSLKNKKCQEILGIPMVPPEMDFPRVLIKAPVPWKCSIQLAKNRLEQVLMVNHPVLQAVNMLWHELYDDLIIFNTKRVHNEIALDESELTNVIDNFCSVAREILINDWLPRVADLIDSMRGLWIDLVAHKSKYGGRAAILFKAIHALMSQQLQKLIRKSVDHLLNTLRKYSNGNLEHAQEPEKALSERHPFMALKVTVVGKSNATDDLKFPEESVLNTILSEDPKMQEKIVDFPQPAALPRVLFTIEHNGKLLVEPYIEELPEILVNYFKMILRVGQDIPRMEYFMSRDEEEKGFLHFIPECHVDMEELFTEVRNIVAANQEGPRHFLKPIYEYYYPILSGKLLKSTENLFLQETIPSLQSFQSLMDMFNEVVYEAYYLRSFVPLNMFMLDNRNVNQVLVNMVEDMKAFIADYFKTKNLVDNRKLCDEFEEISLHAGERPKETPEVVALQNYLSECREQRLFVLKNEIKLVAERVMFLLHYATLDAEDIHLNSRTFLWPSELEQVLDLSAARLSVVREGLETQLRERRAQFELQVLQEKKKVDAFRSKEIRDVLSLDELREKVETVDLLCGILKDCSAEADAINVNENLLQIDQSHFPILNELLEKMDPIEKLWRTAFKFDSKHEGWFFGPFAELSASEIREEVEDMSEVINKLARVLVSNPQAKRYADQIRIKIDKFKVYLPILEAICREGLSERHWVQISEELGKTVNPETFTTLSSLVEIDILRISNRLEEISNAAAKEFELNNQLLQMQSEWAEVKFEVQQYRDSDTTILASVDDIQSLLDDHILKAQAMRGSPYIAALGEKATGWEDKLISMQDILDVWLKVQSTYMYLEPIFNSEDIMRQMPTEGRHFKSVDRIWRKIMKHTETDKRVIQTTDFQNMLATLQKAFSDLEGIQKGLNMYLEKKRLFFARFYFLSNDELLEILSETKDPMRVQPHLKKCFEGIHSLQFDPSMEIIGIISQDGETIPLTKKINPATANGLVEKWLKDVQVTMVESIQEQLRSAYDIYYASVRKNWCIKWPGQIVLAISTLTWTSDVEEAIAKGTSSQYLSKCEQQLRESVSMIRSRGLNSRNRTTIQSLIVQDIYNVSVLKRLVEENVQHIGHFSWLSQLRYNWRVDEIEKMEYVCVSMINTDIQYGLEYLGNVSRIIRTPDTDRCFLTLMSAIKFNLAGSLEGSPGSGKTETCKDLARAVGKKMVVFNCAEGLENRAIGKFLKGLVQSGCWACFDDFNRIQANVLSVVAQQILTIQRAIASKTVKFNFEDAQLKLDSTCAIFITINPTPTSVNNLPDNLRVRFRTVALPVPDIRQIFELSLYSCGFVNSKKLTGILVNFLKLGATMLSAQYHYDFGMRSVKAILRNLIELRSLENVNGEDGSNEHKMLLSAIRSLYTPQLVQLDVEIFKNICLDLFGGEEINACEPDNPLKWKIEQKMTQKNLQIIPWMVEKVLQLHEMIYSRHGIMLIGGPMSGKTTCYQILMTVLREMEIPVQSRVINPKAISIDQLFGGINPETQEWQDGVLAKTFRSMANSTPGERQWIIFDGPIDEVWIENLNTVLDDNKKLCLMSGEIIQMSKEMTMIFEVTDLKQASPATISRCGMIYLDREKIGWKSIHQSFKEEMKDLNVADNNVHLFEILVNWLVEPSLEILSTTRTVLKLSAIHQYSLMRTILRHFLVNQSQYNSTWFQQAFLFSWVWAYFSTLIGSDYRKEVDSQIRRILYGSNEKYPKPKIFTLNRGQIFPEKMNFLDYRFDGIETWWPWLKSDEIGLVTDQPVIDIVVPTMESCMISFWIEFSMKLELPLLLVGPSGSGKSHTTKGFLRGLAKEKFLVNQINMSAHTSSRQVQELIMSKLDRRRKGVFGPPVGRKCLIFIDDLAVSQRDIHGAQPPLELYRQWADHKYWSDLNDTSKLELIDLLYVGAMGIQGGTNHVYERLYRHMFVLAVNTVEQGTMQRIFNSIGEWHFAKDFPEVLLKQAKALCSSVLEVLSAAQQFTNTPQKVHYQFSMLEVGRIYQAITLVPAKRLQESEKLVRLWAHEVYRVIGDRLLDAEERTQLFGIIQSVCSSKLRMSLSQAFGDKIKGSERLSEAHIRDLIFGNYMEPDADPKYYDEVDVSKLEKMMQFYLNEYNRCNTIPMDLVLFHFAIEHISRVARVLQMPRGNVLLFGLGGSGRRSVVRLAATLSDCVLIEPNISNSYGYMEWREDMKRVLLSAGMEHKKTLLMFSDNQAKDHRFFEDIHFLLSSYDLNNIFAPEEKTGILDKMQLEAKAHGRIIESTPQSLYGYFTERVEEKLHLAVIFSSHGESLRSRLKSYPSLRNYCSLTYFSEWNRDALVRVAEHFINYMDLSSNLGSESPPRRSSPTKSISDGPTSGPGSPLRSTGSGGSERETMKSSATLEMERKLVETSIYFNKTAIAYAKKLTHKLGQRLHITPTLYLEFLGLFQRFHSRKFEEITTQRDRYMIGLEKLGNAANEVEVMQQNLMLLQPQLKILSEETERIMVNIERETAEAEKKKEVVGADEAAANEAAASAQAIKDDCESDLQEAIPALDAALTALDTVSPGNITVVKSMKNPPLGVKLVLEAVCVIKGIKPDRKTDQTGKTTEDFWAPSLRMLGDMKFLETLKTFDKDNINPIIMKKIRERFIVDREFVPDKIKSISMACEGLCRWVRAMEIYDRVAKIVAPKKLALAAAEAELAQQMEKLNAKRAELQQILDKLQKLNDFFAEKSREKKRLEDEIDNCEKKLFRAARLIGGLGGEKARWSEKAVELNRSLDNIVGDVLLAAGFVAYLGPFVQEFRQDIVLDWRKKCQAEGIPCSQEFDLVHILGHPTQCRSWSLHGLPTDSYSMDSAIIVTNARRFPLMIDPQGQANKWIQNLERANDLQVIRQNDDDYLDILESALIQGQPVLLTNLGNSIDPGLYPVLNGDVVKQSDGQFIFFRGKLVEFNGNFRLYMTTSLRNPNYEPEAAVLVNVLNFMITETGLRDLLLSVVVNQEKRDLQEKKEQLLVESAHNQESLYQIETQILQVLSSSEGNILEDENAINILSSSRSLSEEIQVKQQTTEATEAEIDLARQIYVPVAKHSSTLFFCILDLAGINQMYQFSLSWYLNLFAETIVKAPKRTGNGSGRMEEINIDFTKTVYASICRSLYEKDKLIFAFLMSVGMLRSEGKLNERDLEAFIIGSDSVIDKKAQMPNIGGLDKDLWTQILHLSTIERFDNIHKEIFQYPEVYTKLCKAENILPDLVPEKYRELNGLQWLTFLKHIRPDSLITNVKAFIQGALGREITRHQPFDIAISFEKSSPKVPLIFLISPGADPLDDILHFAKQRNMQQKCRIISLGEEDSSKTVSVLRDSIQMGHWVVLQNCHYSDDTLDELEKLFLESEETHFHRDFRLWCTSESYGKFPISILQIGVKLTNEWSLGLKGCLSRIFKKDILPKSPIFNKNSPKQDQEPYCQKVILGVLLFHTIVLQRRHFGSIGWNRSDYDFNESDLKLTIDQLLLFCKGPHEVSYEGLKFLSGQCFYGGRITDPNDRRLLLTILNDLYMNSKSELMMDLKTPEMDFTDIGAFITSIEDTPTISVGLHPNAEAFYKSLKEAKELISGAMLSQIELSVKFAQKSEAHIKRSGLLGNLESMLSKIPEAFNLKTCLENFPLTSATGNALNIVLYNECEKYNRICQYLSESMGDLVRMLKGEVSSTNDLECLQEIISRDEVPPIWIKNSFMSRKSLSGFFKELLERIKFFKTWLEDGEPTTLWLGAFLCPQAVFEALRWRFARHNKQEVDNVSLRISITQFEAKSRQTSLEYSDFCRDNLRNNEDFKCFYGLFLEGGRWNREKSYIDEPVMGIHYDELPIFSIKPYSGTEESTTDECIYDVPVYKTTDRFGHQTPLGLSTNFILHIPMSSKFSGSHFVLRGCAAYLQLD